MSSLIRSRRRTSPTKIVTLSFLLRDLPGQSFSVSGGELRTAFSRVSVQPHSARRSTPWGSASCATRLPLREAIRWTTAAAFASGCVQRRFYAETVRIYAGARSLWVWSVLSSFLAALPCCVRATIGDQEVLGVIAAFIAAAILGSRHASGAKPRAQRTRRPLSVVFADGEHPGSADHRSAGRRWRWGKVVLLITSRLLRGLGRILMTSAYRMPRLRSSRRSNIPRAAPASSSAISLSAMPTLYAGGWGDRGLSSSGVRGSLALSGAAWASQPPVDRACPRLHARQDGSELACFFVRRKKVSIASSEA